MGRRRSGGELGDLMEAAFFSPQAGIAAILVGWLMWGPIPEFLIGSIEPVPITDDNANHGVVRNGMTAGALLIMPFIEMIGAIVMFAGALGLFFQSVSRRLEVPHMKPMQANFLLVALSFAIGVQAYKSTASVMSGRPDPQLAAEVDARARGLPSPAAPAVDEQPISQAFPPSGTVHWGSRGQPIGGAMGRLDIWDVTGSPQRKVIRIRSAMVMAMNGVNRSEPVATVYLEPGARVSLNLRAGTVYEVVATAGDQWQGPQVGFGQGATTVSFGQVVATAGNASVIAMGAPDQTADIVPNDRF